jgi:hypothetical protein
MRPTVSTPAITTLSKNMTGLLHLPCCDGAKLTNQAGEKIDRDQWHPRQGVKEGEKLTCINRCRVLQRFFGLFFGFFLALPNGIACSNA